MTKSFLLIGTLALAGIASAKSYDVILAAPAVASGQKIAAGEYEVKLSGNFAVFTNVETGNKYVAAVKAEDSGHKFDYNALEVKNAQSNDASITAVELGGSSTVLELGE